jgi:hypothetical protein
LSVMDTESNVYDYYIQRATDHGHELLMPNAGAHLPPEAGATQERSNCLVCQGSFVCYTPSTS